MIISYNKLWKMLIDKKMNRKDLKLLSGASTTSIAKMGKGENIQTDVLLKICKAATSLKGKSTRRSFLTRTSLWSGRSLRSLTIWR